MQLDIVAKTLRVKLKNKLRHDGLNNLLYTVGDCFINILYLQAFKLHKLKKKLVIGVEIRKEKKENQLDFGENKFYFLSTFSLVFEETKKKEKKNR